MCQAREGGTGVGELRRGGACLVPQQQKRWRVHTAVGSYGVKEVPAGWQVKERLESQHWKAASAELLRLWWMPVLRGKLCWAGGCLPLSK